MTRKDYELIADAISGTIAEYARQGEDVADVMRELAENLATELETDNPRFDREKFRKACGVEL
jgi:urease gamma subunit